MAIGSQMDSPTSRREGFAMGRVGHAANPTGSTLGQSDIMRQARKLLITAPIGVYPTLVSRPANAIILTIPTRMIWSDTAKHRIKKTAF